MAPLRTDVLGKLMVAQQAAEAMPDEAGIAAFMREALLSVPGVADARLAFGEAPPVGSVPPGFLTLPLVTQRNSYGVLKLRLSDPDAFSPYLDFVRNTAAAIATTLESRHNASQLARRNEELAEVKRQLEAALKESELVYRLVVTTMAEGMIFQGSSGEVIAANSAAARILGRSLKEMAGRTPAELFGSAEDENGARLRAGELPPDVTLRTGVPQTDRVIALSLPGGKRIWLSLNSQALTADADTLPHAVVTTFHDITLRRNAEDELRRHRDELQHRSEELLLARDAAEAANKAKSVFLANMSHELRTPLNAILGFSSLLRMEPLLSTEQRQKLDIINRAGGHLLALINDVLEIAKIEAGRLLLDIAPLDLPGMVRDVTAMMRQRADEKGLRLQLDLSPAVPVYIKGDEGRLRQVLVNIVGNAVKFTQSGGVTIRLTMAPDAAGQLILEVEDTGPGIVAEDQERIFKPFVQLGEGGAQMGTGLGLAICEQYLKRMGGCIWVTSTPGKGSVFHIRLPVEAATASEFAAAWRGTPEKEVTGAVPGQPAFRILIAEDEPDNQILLTNLMSVVGLEPKVAENGDVCVKLFKEWQPHFIWMDRRMPVMDGIEATRTIRALPGGKDVKIVAVTASVFVEQRQEMLDAGMDDFVLKPYRPAEIYECLGRLLGLKYTYRESAPPDEAVTAPAPERMAALPVALQIELREALTRLDAARIDAAILRVKETDPELSRVLSRCAGDFDYPAILKVLPPEAKAPLLATA